MKMKQLLFGLFLSIGATTFAQNVQKEVLFTVNDKPYYTDEFARVYNKNLDLVKDESQKDLDQYLELFIGYKLKINKANKLGLQNGANYQSELKTYRAQLSKNYVTDSKVTKELVEEGYQRSQKEVKASHILITVDENAAPEDTLKAYNRISDLRKRALAGEDFGKLAQENSQDPSAKDNKGNLGYFSAFRMVYPFETAAFKTPKGQISNPVRTRFGYHIIKVDDVRDNRGEVQVAHIMILNPKPEEADQDKAKNTINDIYKKLQQGEKFEDLAKQFSEDKSSSSKGGQLSRFGSGQLSSEEFENTAFSLTKENPVSQPFQSKFGWHIVKLIERFPMKTFDEAKADLETKISKDERSRLIANSLNDKLRKKYNVKRDNKVYGKVVKAVTPDFYENKWSLPTDTKPTDAKLFAIQEKEFTGTDFLKYIQTRQKAGSGIRPASKMVDAFYESYLDEQLNAYYNDHLETEFPEFAAVMEEYRDGLLLFDLMEKEIWEKSKTDTLGLKNFYDTRKMNYQWKNRVDVVIASSTNEKAVKEAQKMLKKGSTPEQIKEKLNTKDKVDIMTNVGTFEEGNDALPKGLKFEAGVSDITKDGQYYFVTKVNKVLPAGVKTLEECKGKCINDYQQYLEQGWVDKLKGEFTVRVKQDAFERVKTALKK
ncbi:peptidylprolyl isomerase [Flavobacterium caeni]|uniref:Peptidyl-prolyl cis-trans isomerase SurA n=1 Tax=Flavobacterium caeni TaxID=490189 RepID=A0A1G5HHU1_9FLAO|nr:peptidylprolyl isomerase [Flavobacterium caeni]SCY63251.1 peptidyl-prolyl cis-trans isomerase SurA [Flavobacterium caeni]